MPQRISILIGLSLLLFCGCNGWDDDSEFESRTRAAYFLCEQAATGLNSVHKHADGGLEMGWNQRFGIADGDVGDLYSSASAIWLSDAENGRVLEIDPAEDRILQDISLPHRADHFAVGEREIMVVDTAANQHSFYKRRNGDVLTLSLGDGNGPVLYNNARFYFQSDASTMQVIDEYAYTSRAEAALTYPISAFEFNRFKNIVVQTADTALRYFIILSGVEDRLIGAEAIVAYQKIRHTPYLEARFGREWIEDVRLEGTQLLSGAWTLPDSAANFEVDFFESMVYYQWGDSLFQYDLNANSVTDKQFFNWELRSSAYWLGRE